MGIHSVNQYIVSFGNPGLLFSRQPYRIVTVSRDDYEEELTADRGVIASIPRGVADGVRTGAVRLGDSPDAVTVDTPDRTSSIEAISATAGTATVTGSQAGETYRNQSRIPLTVREQTISDVTLLRDVTDRFSRSSERKVPVCPRRS